MATILEIEAATWERERESLLASHHGRFVLIQGTTVHGCFPTESEALRAAYRDLGDALPFLVRRVLRPEEEVPVLLGVVSTTA